MNKVLGWVMVALLTLAGSLSLGAVAQAQTNEQEGDNSSDTAQSGTSGSGDAVAGQVTGVVSSGDASVDATNHSEDVDVESGDTVALNESRSITGQQLFAPGPQGPGENELEGDNDSETAQAADAVSGDAVGGQVIGVVTSAGGSADVVAANTSEDIDISTGDALAENFVDSFTGQLYFRLALSVGGYNYQDGDNEYSADQSASASTGDGVGGQVLGIVSAGDTSVDATNESTDVDLTTGEAAADNFAGTFTGQQYENISGLLVGGNDLDGDNSTDLAQAADANSGDGVGGQVIGVVTSAGGSADVVAANTSEDIGISTGDALAANALDAFTGQDYFRIGGLLGGNYQDGDNDLEASQSAFASTGDGVGGQVLGVVSAGDTSVDATNESTDIDLTTGDAVADNFAEAFVGQRYIIIAMPGGSNVQEGDNSKDLAQAATAASGDAVGGQVAGVVTSAGGSADLVLANTSTDVDGTSGDSEFFNQDAGFVGQNVGELVIGPEIPDGIDV